MKQPIAALLFLLFLYSCDKDETPPESLLSSMVGQYTGNLYSSYFSPASGSTDTFLNYKIDVSLVTSDSVKLSFTPASNGAPAFPPDTRYYTHKQVSDFSNHVHLEAKDGTCRVLTIHYYKAEDSISWSDNDYCGPGGQNFKFIGKGN